MPISTGSHTGTGSRYALAYPYAWRHTRCGVCFARGSDRAGSTYTPKSDTRNRIFSTLCTRKAVA
eukprot:3934767-Rhodomonas_salina.8